MKAVTNPTRSAVVRGLLAGLGVEDIAQDGIVTVAQAREIVADLRRSGTLRLIVKIARAV